MCEHSTSNDDSQFRLQTYHLVSSRPPADNVPSTATRALGKIDRLPKLIEQGLLNELNESTDDCILRESPTHDLCYTRKPIHEANLERLCQRGSSRAQTSPELLQRLLDSERLQNDHIAASVINVADVIYHLPVTVSDFPDFSDFSSSKMHVLNAGEAVMCKRELPPGFLHSPVGYGSRCSSFMPLCSSVQRPLGPFRSLEGIAFTPSRAADFELEVACVIGKPSKLGGPRPVNEDI